jgi:hypothetical protein
MNLPVGGCVRCGVDEPGLLVQAGPFFLYGPEYRFHRALLRLLIVLKAEVEQLP